MASRLSRVVPRCTYCRHVPGLARLAEGTHKQTGNTSLANGKKHLNMPEPCTSTVPIGNRSRTLAVFLFLEGPRLTRQENDCTNMCPSTSTPPCYTLPAGFTWLASVLRRPAFCSFQRTVERSRVQRRVAEQQTTRRCRNQDTQTLRSSVL